MSLVHLISPIVLHFFLYSTTKWYFSKHVVG